MPCRWLRITELRSAPLRSMFSGPPSSPMGDVMQTPQFQLRRLKKQLAVERENRDELEVELAENRKLITEKGQLVAGHPGVWGGLSGAEKLSGSCDFVMVLTQPRLCLCTVHPDGPQGSTAHSFGALWLSRAARAAQGLLCFAPWWAKGTLAR